MRRATCSSSSNRAAERRLLPLAWRMLVSPGCVGLRELEGYLQMVVRAEAWRQLPSYRFTLVMYLAGPTAQSCSYKCAKATSFGGFVHLAWCTSDACAAALCNGCLP